MGLLELFITAVALSMDAFAVAICKGLARGTWRRRDGVIAGLFFGGFQAGMPLLGYILGSQFSKYVEAFDHWIAFGLLAVIGINMIREAFGKEEESNDSMALKTMLVLAVATSIDALAVGISFAFLNVEIVPAVIFIGVTTFAFSYLGMRIGVIFGSRYRRRAELTGGVILVLIGVKILLEHLGVISL